MEKSYKQTYINLTRNHPLSLPSNCLPLSNNKSQKGSLQKLLSINRNIIDILNPSPKHQKKQNNGHLFSLDSDRNARRIHPNVSYFAASVNPKTERLKAQRKKKQSEKIESVGDDVVIRRKDIYDAHIERFMTNKFDSQDLIQQYLTNRQKFVKEACRDIQQEIKAGTQLKKSLEKKKSKDKIKKLPKLEDIPSYRFRKDKRRSEDGPYLRSIDHLKKAQELNHKDRERKQRVFRKKIHSLQYRLDKIREDPI